MKDQDEKKGVSGVFLAAAALVGSVVGAALGLVFAPQTGDKTREKIRKSYDDVVDNINAVVKKVDDTLPGIVTKVRTELQDMPESMKSELLTLTKDTEERINKAVELSGSYLSDVKSTISSTIEEGKKIISRNS